MIHFVIPIIPVAKGRPRFAKRGKFVRAFTPEKTMRFEEQVADAGGAAMAGMELLEGALKFEAVFDLPIPKSWSAKNQADARSGMLRPTSRPDLDNYIKGVFDGLNNVVWHDDSQVVSLVSHKRYAETPCVHIRVAPINMVQPS